MDDTSTNPEAEATLSHQRVRPTLSSISLTLGICSFAAPFVIVLTVRIESLGGASWVVGPLSPVLMLAGLTLAFAGRRRGEQGSLARAAMSLSKLLLIFYTVALVALFLNPVTPSRINRQECKEAL